jgi:hypothetical protein
VDRFDTDSPERGWEPFLTWLRSHGLNPNSVRAVAVDGNDGMAEVYQRDSNGKLHLTPEHDEVAWDRVPFTVQSPPPRRT